MSVNKLLPVVSLLAIFSVITLVIATRLNAQTTDSDWQKAAGGKMSFEVASVKQNNAEMNGTDSSQNVSLDAGNSFVRTGGLFRATNIPLHWYIRFAYKLETTEFGEIMDELPKWALTTRYDIEARAPGDPTKDQYRLMMQALLADRFKLAVHFENKQMPIWGLVPLDPDKPGRLGPKLRKHSDDPPCPAAALAGQVDSTAAGFPLACGTFVDVRPATEGDYAGGARDVPMSRVADILSLGIFRTYKPVVDETGLAGNYDFVIEFFRDPNDPIGPLQDALKDQLGLKLLQQTGPVQTIAIDHIEQPSPN